MNVASGSREATEPKQRILRAGGVEQVFFEWNAEARGVRPSIVMAHATGFHARCWDETIRRLDGVHVVAVDMRGHGRSPRREAIETWQVFGEDLAALVEALELEGVLGVGHSMGGHAMTHAAALVPGRFSRLLLFDPVILPPETYSAQVAARKSGSAPETHPTERRRNFFESPEAMLARFEDRPPYAHFDSAVLRDYCRFGLVPAVDDSDTSSTSLGGYMLGCAPVTEASVYVTTADHAEILDHVAAVSIPVLVVRAQEAGDRSLFDFAFSPTWPGLANAFPDAKDLHFPHATHFLPLEEPETMAGLVRDQLEIAKRPAAIGTV